MKALVYIVCVAVAAMVQTAISMSGVQLGGLPVVLLYGTALAVATAACKAIQRWNMRPAIPKERWYTCPKGGQLVPEGKPCDCESLSPQPGEKLCGTPFIQAGQTPPGVETEQPKPGKRSPVVPLCIAAALLVVCTCILGYRVSVLTAARDDLAAENAELRSRVSALSTEKTQLQEKVNDLEARNEDLSGYLHDATFLYNNIGFIVEGSNRYHNYDCPVFQGADEYWAHNIEYCEYLGYSKCGNCW